LKEKTKIAIGVFVGLSIGFFLGREYMKYEIRQSLTSFGAHLKKSFGNIGNHTPEKTQEAESTSIEDYQKALAKINSSIQELEEYKRESLEDAENRKKVKIKCEYIMHGEYIKQPAVSISIKNGSKKVISVAHISMKLIKPGRTMPYETGDLKFSIQGGLEPGEVQKDMVYALRSYDKQWSVSDVDPKDLVMKFERIAFYDHEKKPFWNKNWDDEKESELKNLMSKAAKIEEEINKMK